MEKLKNDDKYSYIENVVDELEWWDCFNQDDIHNEIYDDEFDNDFDTNDIPFDKIYEDDFSNIKAKIGRNDQCPCLSGKKYK